MKIQTVALMGVVVIGLMAVFLFMGHDANQRLLAEQFSFLGYPVTVLRLLLGLMFLAALAPSLYFSFKLWGLYRHARALEAGQHQATQGATDADRALALMNHGAPGKALSLVEHGTSPEAAWRKGQALVALHRDEEAVAAFRSAFVTGQLASAGYDLAACLVRLKRSPEETLRTLIERDPKDAREAFLQLLAFYDRQQQWDLCLSVLKEMQGQGHLPPEGVSVAYRYELFRSQNDLAPKRHVENYQQLLKDHPDFVPANLALGEAYLAMNAVEKGFRVFEQAFQKTLNTVFLDRLEAFYLEHNRPEDAIQVYRQLLVKRGGDSLIKFQLGKLYAKLEMLDDSYALLTTLESEYSHLPSFLVTLAEVKRRKGDLEGALHDLRKLAALGNHREFICTHCQTATSAWQARCESCGQWDRICLSIALENLQPQPSAPIIY